MNGYEHATNRPEGKRKVPHSVHSGHGKAWREIKNRRRRRRERAWLRSLEERAA